MRRIRRPLALAAAFIIAAQSLAPAFAQVQDLFPYFRFLGSTQGWSGPRTPPVEPNVRGEGELAVYSPIQVRGRPQVVLSLQFYSDNAQGPVSWNLDSGELPPGLSLSPSGLLSGIPTEIGTWPRIKVRGTDSARRTGTSQPFTVLVPPVPAVTVAGSPFKVTAGQPLAVAPFAVGTYGTSSWTLRGGVPVGMAFDAMTGRLSGRPEQKGSFPGLVAGVKDADDAYGESAPFRIDVDSKLSIAGLQPTYSARAGRAFPAVRPYASGTPGPYLWSIAAGTLPAGLAFDQGTGAISGTPAREGETQAVSVRVRDVVTDDLVASGPVALNVVGAPRVSMAEVVKARAGSDMNASPEVTGLIGEGRWSLVGTLPGGVELAESGGRIGGKPLARGTYPGLILRLVDAYDGASTYSRPFNLVVNPKLVVPVVGMARLQVGKEAVLYPPPVWGLVGTATWRASPPPGMTLDPATGVATGKPTSAGTYFPAYGVTDSDDGARASQDFPNGVEVLPADAVIPFAVGPLAATYPAPRLAPFSLRPTVEGGEGVLEWEVIGQLPAWATYDPSTGRLHGTPTETGTSGPLSFRVTDATGKSAASKEFGIQVTPKGNLAVGAPPLLLARQGADFASGAPTVANADGALSFRLAGGALPPGLTVSPATGEISGRSLVAGNYGGIVLGASDAAGASATSAPFTLTMEARQVGGEFVAAGFRPLMQATVGKSVSGTAWSSGLGTPKSWQVFTGTLPAWTTFDPALGAIRGTAAAEGFWEGLRLIVTDPSGYGAVTDPFAISAVPEPVADVVVPPVLYATAGEPFEGPEAETYALNFPTFALASGTLPVGLQVDRSSGSVRGIPATPGRAEGLSVNASGTEGRKATSNAFSVVVKPSDQALGINVRDPVEVVLGTALRVAPAVVGAYGPVTVTLSGTLPPGMTVTDGLGTISGTPEAVGTYGGLTYSASDTSGRRGRSDPFRIVVVPPEDVPPPRVDMPTDAGVLVGMVTRPFTASPAPQGATGEVKWAVNKPLPPGLSVSAVTGAITGIPTEVGLTTGIRLGYEDAAGKSSLKALFAIDIKPMPELSASIASPLTGSVATAFSGSATVSGAVGGTKWSLRSGSLPAWATLDPSAGALAGTPTYNGTTDGLSLQVTDGAGRSATTPPFSIVIDDGPPLSASIVPTLTVEKGRPVAVSGVAENAKMGASWSSTGTALPPGLALNAGTGAITGAPTKVGVTDGITLTVKDGLRREARTNGLSVTVTRNPLSLAAIPDAVARVGTPFTVPAPAASGLEGAADWTFAGTLPPGMAFDPAGSASGTPTATGRFGGVVTVTDGFDGRQASTAPYKLTVLLQPTASVPDVVYADQGVPFAYSPKTTDLSGAPSYSVRGTLPGWAQASSSLGIVGTPDAPGRTDGLGFVVEDATGARAATGTFSLVVRPARMSVSVPSEVYADEGVAFSYAPGATNAVGAVSYSVGGALPAWAQASPSLGIVGTPPAPGRTDGLTMTLADSRGETATSGEFSLIVRPKVRPEMTAAASASGYALRVGFRFDSPPATATNANDPVAWAADAATPMPDGLAVLPDGTIAGTPTAPGTTQVRLVATDADGRTARTDAVTIDVAPPTSVSVADATVREGAPLRLVPKVEGAVGAQTWSFAAGTPPAWLQPFPKDGYIGGTAAGQAVSQGLRLKVVDADGSAGTSEPFSVAVTPGIAIQGLTATLRGRQGTPFGPVRPTGVNLLGAPSWEATGLPGGIAIDKGNGTLSGVPNASGPRVATVTLTDGADKAKAAAQASFAIVPPLGITGMPGLFSWHAGLGATSLPLPGIVGQRGPTMEWSSVGAQLPSYASLDPQTGQVSIAATGAGAATGRTTGIVIQARDPVDDAKATAALDIELLPALGIVDVPTLYTARNAFAFASSPPSVLNAVPSVTWSWAPGTTPPAWAKVDTATGVISGTPNVTGDTKNLALLAADATGGTARSVPFTLSVYSAPAVSLQPATSAYRLRVGDPFPTLQAKQVGALGTSRWSLVEKDGTTCPAGLAVNDSTGALMPGTVTATGACSFAIRLTDVDGFTVDSASVSLTVAPALSLSGLKPSYVGRKGSGLFTDPVVPSGVQGTLSLALTPAAPPGMAWNTSQRPNVLGGVPSTVFGTTTFTVIATDGYDGRTATATFTLRSLDDLYVANTTNVYLRNGADASTRTFTPVAGYASSRDATRWNLLFGTLPDGVYVNSSTGGLYGVPSVAYPSVFTASNISIQATDAMDGATAPSPGFQVQVAPDPVVERIPDASVFERAVLQEITPKATNLFNTPGAAPSPTWSATGLPAGLTISPSTGAISGRPDYGTNQSGMAYAVVVSVTDPVDGKVASTRFNLSVYPRAWLSLSPYQSTLPTQALPAASGACTSITLSNFGNATATQITATASQDFATCAAPTGTPCGDTLAVNASCTVGVMVASTTPGDKSGTLTVTSPNVVNATALLTGFAANSSGYQLFSGQQSGTFYPVRTPLTVRVLIVGGGSAGLGGNTHGAGGGSGYYRSVTQTVTGPVNILVGAGGNNTGGGNSSFGSIQAAGGTGRDGGSGGGGIWGDTLFSGGSPGGTAGSNGRSYYAWNSGNDWRAGSGQNTTQVYTLPVLSSFKYATLSWGAGGNGGSWGAGGGGGVLVNGQGAAGADGYPNAGSDTGGKGGVGNGAGGGGIGLNCPSMPCGGNAADGMVYVEWD